MNAFNEDEVNDGEMFCNTLFFRVDANPSVGFGHIMRCLSIADAAVFLHFEVFFILSDDHVKEFVASHGYKTIVLGTTYNDLEEEIEEVCSIIIRNEPSTLVVDSYFVTERYLNTLWDVCKRADCRLVYIDDILAFPYPCDVLLNYNIYGSDANYKELYKGAGNIPTLLIGTSFVPLRSEFQNMETRIIRRQGKSILISTGGSDSEHLTLELVRTIRKKVTCGITFHFIIGPMNEDKDVIRGMVKELPYVVLHENVKNMSALMRLADVAISAAGSTLYELCATQTPTITYILAENQIPGAEGFEQYGILRNCGDIRVLGSEGLAQRLVCQALHLCGNYKERCQIAGNMLRVVDGNGAERIVKGIMRWRIKNQPER